MVGEIGVQRRDFLYNLRFWEVTRIVKGYRRRDWLKLQMMAECTYSAMYAMRDPKGKTVKDIFPDLFKEEYDAPPEPSITESEAQELQSLMQGFQW